VRLTVAAMAALAALGMASCGSSDPPQQPHLAACTLAARGDVARILGADVDAPVAAQENVTDELAGRSGCAWTTTDHAKAVLVETVRTADMAAEVRRTGFSAAARYRAAASGPGHTEEAGIGDAAFWDDATGTLHVLAGATYLTLEVAITPPSDAEPTAVGLAQLLVTRLAAVDRAN
jgi:hypothetical protein